MIHASGKVPEHRRQAGGPVGPPGARWRPNAVNIDQSTVSGVDTSEPGLGLVTPSQISKGRYLGDGARSIRRCSRRAMPTSRTSGLGDQVEVGDESSASSGSPAPPLGGQSSDIYVPLGELQKLSDREGRINVLQVRRRQLGPG